MRPRTIIVGYDGSTDADAALNWALDEARRSHCTVRLTHALVWPTVMVAEPASWMETARTDAERMLAAAARQAGTRSGVPVTGHLLDGSPGRVLADLSRQARLVVVGARGHGGFAELLIGSTSVTVAAHAHCPVVVVRGVPRPDRAPVAVGFDGSTGALPALRYAFERAAGLAAPLRVVQVWTPPVSRWVPVALAPLDTDAGLAGLEESLHGLRDEFPDVKVTAEVVLGGAAETLVAASREAQLVVVGSRGHGTLAGALLGSVGRQLLHHALCPVAVVHGTTGPTT